MRACARADVESGTSAAYARRVRAAHAIFLATCAVAVGVAAGCGGGDDEPSTADLQAQLPPASKFVGYKLHREFDWKDPIDFVVQGVPLPQSTDPSTAVKVMKDAGFDGAAGEELAREDTNVGVFVARFGSDDDARDVQSYLYKEGLKLPCYRSCSETPGDLAVSEIPGAKGIQQVPAKSPPADAPPPFTAYGVAFTVGDRLYFVGNSGPPGSIESSTVIDTAQELYRKVSSES